MRQYRDQLIQQGIWNPDDPRDPAADEEAAQVVEEWIQKQIAPFVRLQIVDVPEIYNLPPWYRPLMVWSDGGNTTRVEQEPLPVQEDEKELSTRLIAVCASALAIRRFLYLHPECAAQGQSGD